MALSVRVEGLADVQRKLADEVLLDPALGELVTTAVDFMQEQGGGLGAQRNVVSSRQLGSASDFRTAVSSTLNSPRTAGGSWQGFQQENVPRRAPGWLNKAVKDIEKTWAA